MAYSKIKKDGTPSKPAKHKPISVDEFTKVTGEYMNRCEDKKQVPLLSELASILGISKTGLENYRQKSAYVGLLRKFDDLAETMLIHKGLDGSKPMFPMFLLKSKYGYIEAQYQKIDMNVHGNLGVVQMPQKKPKISAN